MSITNNKINNKNNYTINVDIFPNTEDYSNYALFNNYLIKISSNNDISVVNNTDDFIKIFNSTVFPKKIINKENILSYYSQNLNTIKCCNNCGVHYYEYANVSYKELCKKNIDYYNNVKLCDKNIDCHNNVKLSNKNNSDDIINIIKLLDNNDKNKSGRVKYIYNIDNILKCNVNEKLSHTNFQYDESSDESDNNCNDESSDESSDESDNESDDESSDESDNNCNDESNNMFPHIHMPIKLDNILHSYKISKVKFELDEYNKNIGDTCNCCNKNNKDKNNKKGVDVVVEDIKNKFFNNIKSRTDKNDNKLILEFYDYDGNKPIYTIKTNCKLQHKKIMDVVNFTKKNKLYKLSYLYSNDEDIYMIITNISV
jgi:hypothetical protein